MAKKEKQPELAIKPGSQKGTSKSSVVIYPTFTFEGTLCYKDGKPYGHIVEENESHIIVELRNENPNEYPKRHEFRKEAKESD